MAKHTGITVRIGAAYDEVRTPVAVFDRAEMRKNGAVVHDTFIPGRALVERLNKEVVNAYCDVHNLNSHKEKRRTRRANAAKFNRNKRAA